ncbi:hypothetical protein GGU11DRAFT_772634 [Lentinula aff. detonsa]|nr:hypothetical protein GGU11DRAFT_772634 [Lentinula aff. detonsa]
MIQKVSEIKVCSSPINDFVVITGAFKLLHMTILCSLIILSLFFLTIMSWDMFDYLIFILAPNAIFHSLKKKQWLVKYQLAT